MVSSQSVSHSIWAETLKRHMIWRGKREHTSEEAEEQRERQMAVAGSQRKELCPWQRSWGRRLWHMQRWDRASGNSLFPSIYPQNQSLPTLLFHALTYTSDFMGGWPPTTSLGEGVNLQLQLIKIPGHDKSVSTYKLLWSFSSLPEQVHPATCDCLQPPNRESMRCFKTF